MKIIQLTTEQFKAIDAIEIKPDGDPIVLTGDNAQGKSSILDSIYAAITGKMPSKPIKDGKNKAKIRLDLGEITIERRITDNASYLELKDAEGNKVNSPQKVLNELLGALTFDPLEFTRMKPKDQRESLMQAAGIDLSDIEAQYKAAYEERTIAGREEKRAKAHYEELPASEYDTSDIPDMDVLLDRRKSIIQTQKAHKDKVSALKRKKSRVSDIQAEIKDLQDRIETLQDAEKNILSEANEIESHPQVNINISDTKNQIYVSISGKASIHKDEQKMKELMNPMVKAWFPDGIDDPTISLIKVQLEKAAYWTTENNKLTQLFELGKAWATGEQENIGEHETIEV